MGPYSHWMFALILVFPGVAVSGEIASQTVEGDTMTLHCTYSVTANGRVPMCWEKGECGSAFSLSCKNVIIKTDGSKVTTVKSNKYQLLGNIEQGNVSLTITNVTKEDEGIYCCRVEIPGWFNDKKNTYNVMVHKRNESVAGTESTDKDKHKGTSGLPVTEADDNSCSENYDDGSISPSSVNTIPNLMAQVTTDPRASAEVQSNPRMLYMLIPILVLIVIALTTIIVCRHKAKDKTPSVSAGPMTELAASGTTAEENIYTED